MIQYFSASESARANGEHDIMAHQNQQREPQNEGTANSITLYYDY